MEDGPNEYVDALAQWLPVETLRLFERTGLDHGNKYVLDCTAGLWRASSLTGYLQSLRTSAMKEVHSELKSVANNQLMYLTISVQVTPNLHPQYSFGL